MAHRATDASTAHAAVADALARLSEAWRNRRYDELANSFDERVVMALPGFAGRVEGRSAMVEGYREFMERSTLTRYAEQPPVIEIFGDTAVANYRWELSWTTNGVANDAAGHDLFVLRNVGDRSDANDWRVVWRTMSVDSEAR